ncbi:MAG: N-acetyl-gamma-glutamyl-phosphate reductase [Acidimicrobiales bacterium]
MAEAFPPLAHYRELKISAEIESEVDIVLSALPTAASAVACAPFVRAGVPVIDIAADFRLKDAGLYPTWYGEPHAAPELLAEFAFGIPELFRDQVRGADLVAAAGCYVTAAALALTPLVRAGAIEPGGIIVDAASGVSGAGRVPAATTHFSAANEDFTAYGLLNHRHTPEIEQATGASVLFTPHLAPMTRGILATCYARPTPGGDDPLAVLRRFYEHEAFVVVGEQPPSTKATLGSNCAHLTARLDPRTGWVVVLCALDNLVKGASGQAVQCANLALGLDETAGLPRTGLYP